MALLLRLFQKCSVWTICTVLLCALAIGASLLWNQQVSVLIQLVSGGLPVCAQAIWKAVILLLCNAALALAVALSSGWCCETMAHTLRMALARHLIGLDYAQSEASSAGAALSQLQNEAGEASGFLRTQFFPLVDDIIRYIGTLAWLLYMDPMLTLWLHIPVWVAMVYTLITSQVIGEAAKASQQANADMTRYADTLLALFPIIRVFDAASLLRARYAEAVGAWECATIREERRKAGLLSLSGVLSFLPLLTLIALGGAQVIGGKLMLGTFYVFINLSGNISTLFLNLPMRVAAFRRFAANMERLEPNITL